MTTSPNVNPQIIQQWLNANLSDEEVKLRINQLSFEEKTATDYLKEFKKLKMNKRMSQGFVFMVIGAVIGFISCVLSILNPIPEWYNFILYGLTSLAIFVAFIGLYLVFE